MESELLDLTVFDAAKFDYRVVERRKKLRKSDIKSIVALPDPKTDPIVLKHRSNVVSTKSHPLELRLSTFSQWSRSGSNIGKPLIEAYENRLLN